MSLMNGSRPERIMSHGKTVKENQVSLAFPHGRLPWRLQIKPPLRSCGALGHCQFMRVIGTRSVDHGKSTISPRSGHTPDRSKEEQAREMTIELSFAG
jgi:hypothetical protein